VKRPTLYVADAGGFRPAGVAEVLDGARAVAPQKFKRGAVCTSPRLAEEYLRARLQGLSCEVFGMLALDTRHRLIEALELFTGTVDGASVHPREVVKHALRLEAAAVILFHNHPSGIAEPSRSDELITTRLRDALALVDVRVVDHLIIGETVTSLAERGLL
jgi:DNA repair protein RadC